MRARQEDPWKAFAAGLKEGDRLQGKVVRLQPFGAFVELRPGVDGLIHISAMSERRIAHPRDVLKVGETVELAVEKVDPAEKRIGLRLVVNGAPVGSGVSTSMPAAEPARESAPKPQAAPRPKAGQGVQGKVDRIEPYGVFLVFPGGQGLVPASETGTERGTDLKRHFQLGQELKAQHPRGGRQREDPPLRSPRPSAPRSERRWRRGSAASVRRVAAERASAPWETSSRGVSCRA